MKRIVLALLAATVLGSAALAQTYVDRRAVVAPGGRILTPDEVRDDRRDRLDRRQELDRRALRLDQSAERQALGLDEDDDEDDED